jgi:2-polyprenyl-6-hydroxyphenyl methylase/3-demethylubiquinone-9 3-methyltransferase
MPLQEIDASFVERRFLCKICFSEADHFCAVDFNKNCDERRGRILPLSGTLITYRRCRSCQFIFTNDFDNWTEKKFAELIYNEAYRDVDPDYDTHRPRENAEFILKKIAEPLKSKRILDYGGGNGFFAETLKLHDIPDVATYDPFNDRHCLRPSGYFDVITCYEVLEHAPDPRQTVEDIVSFLNNDGTIIFSTMPAQDDIDLIRGDWWYIAPRNGHCSIFSKKALIDLWGSYGFELKSIMPHLHVAFKPNRIARSLVGN